MTGSIEDVANALRERAPLLRSESEEWREEIPPEDSAPSWAPEPLDTASWGVTQEQAQEMLRRQVCPVCGEGPWKSPLIHASKRHGINKRTMREACGMTLVDSVADPELSQRFSERMRESGFDGSITVRGKRPKYRTTAAGRAATAANFRAVSDATRRANLEKARAAQARPTTS